MLVKHTGKTITELCRSVIFFFLFSGHLSHCILYKRKAITWHHTMTTTLSAGARMVLPLILVSMLMGMSLALSVHYILSSFYLQNQAMDIAQSTIIRDFAPLPIGFILCVQCGLNLINADHPSLHHSPQKVLLETIIPLIISINFTALLLYTYVVIAFFIGIYLTFYYFFHVNTYEYILRLHEIIRSMNITASVCKTLLYATIASFTAGYYYYEVASRALATRVAVSRIITRSLFWLIFISVLLKI